MITSAFLIKIIVYGLVIAVIIPAIDFILVVFRESRRSYDEPIFPNAEERPMSAPRRRDSSHTSHPSLNPASPARPDRQSAAPAPAHQLDPKPASAARPDPVVQKPDEPITAYPVIPSYTASNGVTITPSRTVFHDGHVARAQVLPSGHPHAEYWSYGNVHFYQHR